MKNIQEFCRKFNIAINRIKNINKNIFPEMVNLVNGNWIQWKNKSDIYYKLLFLTSD
jgi:hypothetical protein